MTSLGDVAARGTGVTLSVQALRVLLQMASLILLARLLTPEDFGIVAMVTAITGVAELIRDFGLSLAAIQARELSNAERTNLFWANVAIGVGCCVAIILTAPLIVRVYGEPLLTPIIFAVAGVFVISGATTQFRAELTRSLRFGALALADVLAQAGAILIAIALAVLGARYWAIVAQMIAVALLTLLCSVVASRWRPGLPRRAVSLGRFFRFGGGVVGTQLLSYAMKNADNVAIGIAWGAGPLGLYTRAYQLVMAPLSQVNAPLTGVALPVLSRVQDDDETFARYVAKAQLVGCYVTATALCLCAGMAEPLVDVLFGGRWAPVAPIFALLAIGGVFRSVSQISYWIYLARGLTGAQLRLYLVLRPAMILIMLAGLPWGPRGVAAGCSLAFLADWLVTLWHVGRVAAVDSWILLRKALQSLLLFSVPCGLVAFAATHTIDGSGLQLVLGLAVAGVVAAVLALVVPTIRADLRTILSLGRRALRRAPVG